MQSSYLIFGEITVILIVFILALWNVFRSAGDKFAESQTLSNFEFIIYASGEFSLSLFAGHIFLVITSFIISLIGLNISSNVLDNFAFAFSFIIFCTIYYRTKFYQNQVKEIKINREKTQIVNIINDLKDPVEIIFCRTRWRQGYDDIFCPEEMFKTNVYNSEKVGVTLKNDDDYGVLIIKDYKRMYFDLNEDTPKFQKVSEYIEYYEANEQQGLI